jgi:hypothetical protein
MNEWTVISVCALLGAIYVELRGCRSALDKMATRIGDVNFSMKSLIENVEATNRRLDHIQTQLSREESLDAVAEVKKFFDEHAP